MEKISIIMPLYNAAKYLSEALQSVLRQTYRNFEIICINDCSTDNTAEILWEFQRKDARIRILANRERMGAGPSRNKGLKAAEGKYVIFLDGDDLFAEELLEKAEAVMERHQADVVLFEALHVQSEAIYIKRVVKRSESFIRQYCLTAFDANDLEAEEFQNISNAPWDKMFLRSFLEENRLEFQNLPSSNDVYFVKMALFCAKRMIWSDDRRVMIYVRDHETPSRISNDRDPMCAYCAMEKLAAELNERNMFGRFAELYYCIWVTYMLYLLKKEKNEERKRRFYRFLKEEGVSRCIYLGKEHYNAADSYCRAVMERILNSSCECDEAGIQETYFQYYLRKNGQAVLTFLKDELKKGRKIVLWGTGVNGRSLLAYLEEHAVRITAAADADVKKQGTVVNGYTISSPEDICRTADVIVTTSKQILWEIKDRTAHLEIEQVNLTALLREK